jgi:hypothetical protein
VVDHPHLHPAVDGPAGEGDRLAVGVAAGVVEQVGEHLVEPDRVDQDGRQVVGHVDQDPVAGLGAGQAHHRPDHVGQGGLDQVGVERAGLDPRHVEQVVHQPAQPIRLLVDGLQELPLLRPVPGDVGVQQAGG